VIGWLLISGTFLKFIYLQKKDTWSQMLQTLEVVIKFSHLVRFYSYRWNDKDLKVVNKFQSDIRSPFIWYFLP